MASRRKFQCLDCRVDTGRIGEHYMLTDAVWFSIHNFKTGMLCVGCVETRLGRRLMPEDFNSSYVNRPRTAPQSLRLVERLSR